jgi:hypothetical protein
MEFVLAMIQRIQQHPLDDGVTGLRLDQRR